MYIRKIMIDQKELKLQFSYNPESGVFTRTSIRDCHGNIKPCNYEITGTNGHRGYKRVSINGERYLLHKLAVMYMTGEYPNEEVDHADGDTSNNSYLNLRNVGKSENRKNLKLYKTNTSGVTGVHQKEGKYYAQIRVDGVTHFKGYFCSVEEAIQARNDMNSQFKFHENHGKR